MAFMKMVKGAGNNSVVEHKSYFIMVKYILYPENGGVFRIG